MVLARVTVLVLFLTFLGLSIGYSSMKISVERKEAAWANNLGAQNPHRLRDLRQWLINNGVQIKREGALTRLVYAGSHANFVAIVNRLLNEPVEWTRWSADLLASDALPNSSLQGSITLKNL